MECTQKRQRENLLKPRHLDEPTLLLGVDLMIDGPFGKLVPFVDVLAVNGKTEFGKLILALLQVSHDLLQIKKKE